jgi:hypothetical protein
VRVALRALLAGVLAAGAAVAALVLSPDPLSGAARRAVAAGALAHQEAMLARARRDGLTPWDRAQIHAVSVAGIALGTVCWPEAAAIVRQSLYGDGTPVVVSGEYFARSPYLAREAARRGIGDHGPIGMRQRDDWRTSLAFNPFRLRVTRDSVTLYSPGTRFVRPDEETRRTVIPLGRLHVPVYDNLFGAIQGPAFLSSASWARR